MRDRILAYTYILTNDRHTVLYVGSTNDLKQRTRQHKRRLIPGFTKKYNVHQLVYFEVCANIDAARRRERALKGLTRAKKEALIGSKNSTWADLTENPLKI